MALIKCPECEKEVSDTAIKCTNCGVQLREPTRSFIGKCAKWIFIGFNVLMLIWMVGGISSATEGMEGMSDAERAGASIGAGIGTMMIMVVWAFGGLILGMFFFFTRPKN